MGLWNAVEGAADHAAGSTDEAVGRAVDSAGDGDVAGVGDHLAGNMDEAVGRTFDDQQGGGVVDGTVDAVAGVGERALDVPADALNATTGTGENLGWFGEFDRAADPRSWSGEEPDWAEPSEQTDGISGLFAGATGATGHVVDEASSGAGNVLLRTPKLLALLVVAILVMLAPYARAAANLSD
jgi:uncharacterized protein YjbJ (UPF0337 family)